MLHDSLSSLILEHGQELDDWSNEILNDKKWKRWLQQLERKEHLRQFELCNDIADRKLFDTIQFDIPACYIVRWERLLPNHIRNQDASTILQSTKSVAAGMSNKNG